MSSRQTGPSQAVRDAVYQREGFCCAICGSADGPFSVHHRRPRGLGGSRRPDTNGLSNLVLICDFGGCHDSNVESHRERAIANGWLIRQGFDPSTVPFLYRGEWRILTDLGAVERTEAAS